MSYSDSGYPRTLPAEYYITMQASIYSMHCKRTETSPETHRHIVGHDAAHIVHDLLARAKEFDARFRRVHDASKQKAQLETANETLNPKL